MTFVPTDITGCKLWLDFSDATTLFTDAGTTPVSADGQAIYQANDKSGNNFHAVQTSAGNRPLYKTSVQNSKSVARFDGDNSWLDLTGLTSAASSYTLFFVFYNNESPDSSGKYLIDSQSGRLIFALYAANVPGPKYTGYYDGAWVAIFENTTTKWQIDTWKLESGVGGYVYQDGVLKGNDTYTAKAIGGTTRLGMPYNSDSANTRIAMDLAEIVLYTSALSDTDRQSVETYLNNKWAIYIAPPDALTAVDFTLNPVNFDAPTLENVAVPPAGLTAKDFTLSAVTFDKPNLATRVITPICRTFTVEAESRSYAIEAESRSYAIEAESRGYKVSCTGGTAYEVSVTYSGMTAKDFTLSPFTFDAPTLVGSWWLVDGISAANVIAAYQPKGATTYAASKVNLANPGTYNLTDSNVDPMWIKSAGWANKLSEYLLTGFTPNGTHSVIALFNCSDNKNAQNTLLGSGSTDYFEVFARRGSTGDDHLYYYGGSPVTAGERLIGSHVIAMTPDAGYLDGVKDADLAGGTVSIANDVYIFTSNRGTNSPYFIGSIQAVAIYEVALTQAQVTAITARLDILNDTFDFDEMQGIFEWFQKPSAVRFVGTYDRTYISWINIEGKIQARYYDHTTDTYSQIYEVDDLTNVDATEAIDDHNPPNIYITETGQIQLRYCVHDVVDAMYQKISTNVEDISTWGSRTTIADAANEVQNYPQVKRMTDGTLVLFYRRGSYNNAREYFKKSTDGGLTWGTATELINNGTGTGTYAFVENSGNEIHVAWNYQLASAGKRLNIYHMYSTDAGVNWKKLDGTAITLPATLSTGDLVFDSGADQAYTWDIRLDSNKNPYIVFAYKEDPNHEFRYAKYDSGWTTSQITTSANLYEPAAHFYSGGVVIDPNDVNIVYLSKKHTNLEIEKWITSDGGANWSLSEAITSNSTADNFRLQVVENYATGHRLVWCHGAYYGLAGSADWIGYDNVFIRFEE